VAGHVRDNVEDRGGLAQAPLDRRCHERLRPPLGTGGVGLDGGLEARPACESQLASDDQLGRRQGDGTLGRTPVVADEALDSTGLLAAGGVTQLLGLASQLGEVGPLRKRIGHGVSLLRLRSAAQAEEEATANVWSDSEVDSVLPADPVALSSATLILAAPGGSDRRRQAAIR